MFEPRKSFGSAKWLIWRLAKARKQNGRYFLRLAEIFFYCSDVSLIATHQKHSSVLQTHRHTFKEPLYFFDAISGREDRAGSFLDSFYVIQWFSILEAKEEHLEYCRKA